MIYTIQNEWLTAEVSSRGAELKRLVSADGVEYLCPESRRNWNGSAPVLFPNTGWVKDGFALVDGVSYPYQQHGFAKEAEFSPVEQSESGITMELRWSEATLVKCPFRFVLRITYRLEGMTLKVENTVENEGAEPMYYSIGFHPGFSCPMVEGERAEDYRFRFEKPMTAHRRTLREALAAETIPAYWDALTELPVKEGMFDGGSFTMTEPTCRTVRLESMVSGRFAEVDLGDYPNLVVWAPKYEPITNICIEPWFGIPDTEDTDHQVEHKAFTVCLKPRQERRLCFEIRVG